MFPGRNFTINAGGILWQRWLAFCCCNLTCRRSTLYSSNGSVHCDRASVKFIQMPTILKYSNWILKELKWQHWVCNPIWLYKFNGLAGSQIITKPINFLNHSVICCVYLLLWIMRRTEAYYKYLSPSAFRIIRPMIYSTVLNQPPPRSWII